MAYAITKAYDLRTDLKADGAKWDADRKAWIISDELFAKYQARTSGYSAKWWTAWQASEKQLIEG